MGSRLVQYFAMPDELRSLIERLRNTNNVAVLSRRSIARTHHYALHCGVPDECFQPSSTLQLLIIEKARLEGDEEGRYEQAIRLGAVHFDPCQLFEQVLYMGQFSAKNDWYDPATEEMWINPGGFALFNRVKRSIASWGRVNVYASMKDSPKWVLYRQIRCSEGARQFFVAGGKLRQFGVANVIFEVRLQSRHN